MQQQYFFRQLMQGMMTLVLLSSCRMTNPYTNNDSTAIYSTNSSKPFKYGYAYDKAECRYKFESLISDFELKSGEVIADVGAASGWVEGAISVLMDSMDFYVEDIDTMYANPSELGKVVNYYSNVRGSPQTNTFHFVKGTIKTTELPDTIFDKIILFNSFHEFKYVHEMIADISMKIKPGGKLMVSEGFSNNYKDRTLPGCLKKGYKVIEIVQLMSFHGFYLTAMTGPMNAFYNCLTFQQDREASKEFFQRIGGVDTLVSVLDKLNERQVVKDSVRTNEIGLLLKANMNEISKVYKTLEDYISSLGNEWARGEKYYEAINVLRINAQLYPESPFVYDDLGEVYLKDRQYKKAIESFRKSIACNPANKNAVRKLDKIKRLRPELYKASGG
jgi:tetratricopeptide (TPR) repeat protein